MFRCPFFMQLGGGKNDPPICFCLSKVELQRQQVRQMGFPVPPRGPSGVPKPYKIGLLSAWRAQKAPGEMLNYLSWLLHHNSSKCPSSFSCP